MTTYKAVIGLEVHVHLATKSKLFCSCSTKFGQEPNTNVCEICSGMPGSLPSPNRDAIRLAAIIGLATNCEINQRSVFARKNYFYPDLPLGYQISQFDLPICKNGFVSINVDGIEKKIGITRIHMENDAGKNIHSQKMSFVDLNRAGTPMVEIVSEPDMNSPQEAVAYLKALHELVTYLGISDGNMEEGSFRCDANVSLMPEGATKLGTRTELKNINSFRNVQKALEYEIERQTEELSAGRSIIQETRLYDANKNITQGMRSKEEAEDYRYFPDPDLLPVEIADEMLAQWKKELPELPSQRKKRFEKMTGLGASELDMLVQNKALADFFDETVNLSKESKKTANFILGNIARICNTKNIPMNPQNNASWNLSPQNLAELIQVVDQGLISAKIAADIFEELFETGISPKKLIDKKGLSQISDPIAIESLVDKILKENPAEVNAYKNGKTKLLSFFMGQVMKLSKGKANPAIINDLLKSKLN